MYGMKMKMIVKNLFLRKCCQAPKLYKKWTENQAISNRFDGVINPDGIIDHLQLCFVDVSASVVGDLEKIDGTLNIDDQMLIHIQ